jgi:uncharacterized repeat protein (TIGR01451 family)
MTHKRFVFLPFIGLFLVFAWLIPFRRPYQANAYTEPPPPEEWVEVETMPAALPTAMPKGIAYWATSPTEPDFQGIQRIPFQVVTPDQMARELSLQQIQPELSSDFFIENIQVSESGLFTYASHYLNDFSEVMVSIDPTNPNHLLGASKFFYAPQFYDFYTGVFESYDGGLTWTQFQPAGVETYALTSDPVTTFDHLGNGYFTLLTRVPTGLDMLKKPVGSGWEMPVIVDRTTSTDKQWIIADQDPQSISPYSGNLYMSWTSFGGPVTGIVFSRSIDGNQTWSTPIALAGGDVQGSIPGVAPDGTVYVIYGRNIFYGPTPGTVEVVKSVNGGASFSPPSIAAQITAIPFQFPDPFNNPVNFRSPASLPAFAVSPVDGSLFIAWADYRHGDSDIYFARSVNGGSNWSIPVRLNDDPISNGYDQFQPQISVSVDGRVAVMWFDRRLPCPDLSWIPVQHRGKENGCIDTYMIRSYDAGQSWTPNARVSAQSWDWTLNLPVVSGNVGFIGDYQGIASSQDFDFPFWNATANLGENIENYQEVFVARVPVPFVNLSTSQKIVTPELVMPGDFLTYTIQLENTGLDSAENVMVTDTIPVSTTYKEGSLSYPNGEGGYDPSSGVITWTGTVSVNLPAEIVFQVNLNDGASDGMTVVNTAYIQLGDVIYQESVTATVVTAPRIVSTLPADGVDRVSLDAPIIVYFSEAMNPASLDFAIQPDPGNWNVAWNTEQTVVTLTHSSFNYQENYTVAIDAEDPTGFALAPGEVPNPWSFTTVGEPPFIVSTIPANGEAFVEWDQDLGITFNQSVVTETLVFTMTPDPGGWGIVWNQDTTVVTLTHVNFEPGTVYTTSIDVQNVFGDGLVPGLVPNPWSFSTQAAPPIPAVILSTIPADGQVGVPLTQTIEVDFSKPILRETLVYTMTPPTEGILVTWNLTSTKLILSSTQSWEAGQSYTIQVFGVDLDGLSIGPGPVPNPWEFFTQLPAWFTRIFFPLIQLDG